MSIDYVIVDDLGHRHGLINKQVNHNKAKLIIFSAHRLTPSGRRSDWMIIKNRVKSSPGCRTKLDAY